MPYPFCLQIGNGSQVVSWWSGFWPKGLQFAAPYGTAFCSSTKPVLCGGDRVLGSAQNSFLSTPPSLRFSFIFIPTTLLLLSNFETGKHLLTPQLNEKVSSGPVPLDKVMPLLPTSTQLCPSGIRQLRKLFVHPPLRIIF